jgi:oligopeptide transport system substrate-binding protein
LRFNNAAEPETLDPAVMTGQPEGRIADALFEGLTGFDPQTLKPVPGAAERWEISEDGKTYTFHLRECRWSNGDPLTANDFVYSWKRVMTYQPVVDYVYQMFYLENAEAFTKKELVDFSRVGVRALDDRTLEVRLKNPTPYFLDLVSFYTFFPVHQGCVERHGKDWTRPEHIVGNGPFTLDQHRVNDRIRLKKNPNYWDASRVALDEVEITAVDSADTYFNMYEGGELDWIDAPPLNQIPFLKNRPDGRIVPALIVYFYRFNVTRKPFDDPRVRKAFNLALDKRQIVEHVLQAGQIPAVSFVPPGIAGYSPPDGLPYDPEEARRLLAEAGFPEGAGFPKTELLYNTSEQHRDIAVAAQQMWKKNLGVSVELVNQEWKVYLDSVKKLDFQMARAGWIGDYADPNTFLDLFVTGGGNNNTGWSHPEYDRLIRETASAAVPAERMELFRRAEKMLVVDELPILPVYFYVSVNLVRSHVRGWYPNVRDIHPLKHISIAR